MSSIKPWIFIQQKAFVRWINIQLLGLKDPKVQQYRVVSLSRDLADGVCLNYLVRELSSGRYSHSFNASPKFRIHYIDNISKVLEFLQKDGVPIHSIGAEDILEGNLKLILGLIWVLILKYTLSTFDEDFATAKKALLAWCQSQTAQFDVVRITDFTSSWNSGVALCALLCSVRPDLIDFYTLDLTNKEKNTRKAISLATGLGIPNLVDPEDLLVEKPDEKVVVTYLFAWHERFSSQTPLKDEKGANINPFQSLSRARASPPPLPPVASISIRDDLVGPQRSLRRKASAEPKHMASQTTSKRQETSFRPLIPFYIEGPPVPPKSLSELSKPEKTLEPSASESELRPAPSISRIDNPFRGVSEKNGTEQGVPEGHQYNNRASPSSSNKSPKSESRDPSAVQSERTVQDSPASMELDGMFHTRTMAPNHPKDPQFIAIMKLLHKIFALKNEHASRSKKLASNIRTQVYKWTNLVGYNELCDLEELIYEQKYLDETFQQTKKEYLSEKTQLQLLAYEIDFLVRTLGDEYQSTQETTQNEELDTLWKQLVAEEARYLEMIQAKSTTLKNQLKTNYVDTLKVINARFWAVKNQICALFGRNKQGLSSHDLARRVEQVSAFLRNLAETHQKCEKYSIEYKSELIKSDNPDSPALLDYKELVFEVQLLHQSTQTFGRFVDQSKRIAAGAKTADITLLESMFETLSSGLPYILKRDIRAALGMDRSQAKQIESIIPIHSSRLGYDYKEFCQRVADLKAPSDKEAPQSASSSNYDNLMILCISESSLESLDTEFLKTPATAYDLPELVTVQDSEKLGLRKSKGTHKGLHLPVGFTVVMEKTISTKNS